MVKLVLLFVCPFTKKEGHKMSPMNLVPSVVSWMLRAGKIQAMAKKQGGIVRSGFSGAAMAEPHFLMSDPFNLVGFTLYYNGCAGQLAVLKVKEGIERGLHITIVAKNISDMSARDFVLVGAGVNLIDFDTRPIRMFNLISDGIIVHAILGSSAGYGQVLDLKKEERQARSKGGRGYSVVYVLGHFDLPFVARVHSNGIPYKQGKDKRDDIVEAGGCAIDLERFRKCGGGSKILAYALEG
jgi:hypothetical protein